VGFVALVVGTEVVPPEAVDKMVVVMVGECD